MTTTQQASVADTKFDGRCLAVCIEADHEYRLDLTRFGVRRDWTTEAIWDVARREMRRSWGKPVTAWGWERLQ